MDALERNEVKLNDRAQLSVAQFFRITMPLTAGYVLNTRYRIVKTLGQGGFGVVYSAWDLRLNAPCAVKENLDVSLAAQNQFSREAQIASSLIHPNLVRVTDYFFLPGQGQYLVMDFVAGEDLQTKLNAVGAPLPEAQVLKWVGQICDALAYLHFQSPPVIHRDIKPANIKIPSSGNAILVDFGIAKIFDPQLKTTVGARAVSPGYSPIEQYGGHGVTDKRTDLYALGATLYALLTGAEPVESIQRSFQAQIDTLPLPRSLNPHLSPHLEPVILRAMAIQPVQRYQEAREFKSALFTVPPTLVIQPPPPPPKQQSLPSLSLSPILFLVILIAVCLLASAIGIGAATSLLATPTNSSPATAMVAPAPTAATSSVAAPTALPSSAASVPVVVSPTFTARIITVTPDRPSGHIAFMSYRDNDEEIYVMNADGSEQKRLTNRQYADSQPRISPDGKRIVFVSQRELNFEIYMMGIDGSDQRNISRASRSSEFDPSWSPDGKQIVFSSSRGGEGTQDLWIMNDDGSNVRQLTFERAANRCVWSPDGQWIAYNLGLGGSNIVRVIRPDGTGARNVVIMEKASVFGWSGQKILLGNGVAIYSINIDGSDLRQLTPDVGRAPSGMGGTGWIVFNTNRDGDDEIYIMRADGSGQTRLTFSAGNDYMPSWGP